MTYTALKLSKGGLLITSLCFFAFTVLAEKRVKAAPNGSTLTQGSKTNRVTEPLSLGASVNSATPSPALNGIGNVSTSLTGRLVYARRDSRKPTLVLHELVNRVAVQGTSASRGISTTTYTFERSSAYSDQEVFSPVLSPNGEYILFKFGDPGSVVNRYQLYILDIKMKSLTRVVSRPLSYELVSWSPDSNYICFVDNGDYMGNINLLGDYIGPLKLYVCYWRTGKENLVIANDTIRGPFQWIAPHTLFYGVLPKTDETRTTSSPVVRPNIYEFMVENGKSSLIIKDGYRPFPSTDGKFVAFFGSENPDNPFPLLANWEEQPQGISLVVTKRHSSNRVPLNREGSYYPSLQWFPRSNHLLSIDQIAKGSSIEAQVKEWDVNTQSFRQVALLQAKNYKLTALSPSFLAFSLVNVSPDESKLRVIVTEIVAQGIFSYSLREVDLRTGAVTSVAQLKGVAGVSWIPNKIDANE